MTSRNTWLWVTLALGLAAFIFFFERHWVEPMTGPPLVLPGLKPDAVTSVQIRQSDIRADRTNGGWQLLRPLSYPAHGGAIEALLTNLAQLRAQTHISGAALRQHTNADAEFGLDLPQASLLIQEASNRHQVLIGSRTPPGDQVFLQVVGTEGLYVVDAELLKWVPRSTNEWRDTAFVNLRNLAFDRIVVTNSGAAFELQRDSARKGWRLAPMGVRADASRIEDAVRALEGLRVTQFVTDEPRADGEGFGLQPPSVALQFAHGSNTVLYLAFGKNPTNTTNQVFARRLDFPAVVTVGRDPLAPWLVAPGEFRDRHLLNLYEPVETIEVRGGEAFTVERQATGSWRLQPQDLPADTELVGDLITNLTTLRASDFFKDVVIPQNLTNYGLTSPARQFILRAAPGRGGATNLVLGQLDIGDTQGEKTYVRRLDEDAVYMVKAADLQALPTAAFQLRERRIWNQSEEQVARVVTRQGDKTRELVRNGTNSWSVASGSQGLINPFAVEETVHRLGELHAVVWVAVGEQHLARLGFQPDDLEITLELKTGDKLTVRLGGASPSRLSYAATSLAGQVWIFECPPTISELARAYLSPVVNRP